MARRSGTRLAASRASLNSPLTPKGVEQARAAGRFLRTILPEELDIVLETSPLGRARTTAELIAAELGLCRSPTIRSSPLLMEYALGAWEGLTYAEIDDRFPGARQAREADKWRYVIDGGESYALASERARRWLAGCAAPLTVAVTHEMMSRATPGRLCVAVAGGHLGPLASAGSPVSAHGGEITEIGHCPTMITPRGASVTATAVPRPAAARPWGRWRTASRPRCRWNTPCACRDSSPWRSCLTARRPGRARARP